MMSSFKSNKSGEAGQLGGCGQRGSALCSQGWELLCVPGVRSSALCALGCGQADAPSVAAGSGDGWCLLSRGRGDVLRRNQI